MLLEELLRHDWSATEIERALESDDASALLADADRLRGAVCGDVVHRRGLIEFSNHCARNCTYCGLRRDNRSLKRYRMSGDEVVECARRADRLGYGTVVLQSGEDPGVSTDELARWVERIKRQTRLAVTLSVGEKTLDEYRRLRQAGADRYLIRFETSDRLLYARLKPESRLQERLEKIYWLKSLGYQTGSGCMIGLPGQTVATLVQDLLLLEQLDLDMVGVGPFIPHPQTPLASERPGTIEMTLRVVALVRLVTKRTHVPATTATGSIAPDGRQRALRCGANVIMPNVTPQTYRRHYEIYPNKICLTERPEDCSACVGGMIRSLGRTVTDEPGHSLKLAPSS